MIAREGTASCEGQDAPDAFDGGVGVVGWVLGEEFDDDVFAAGNDAETVGEGAAAIWER